MTHSIAVLIEGKRVMLKPVRVKFVPSALNDAVAQILVILYQNEPIPNKLRDDIIRER